MAQKKKGNEKKTRTKTNTVKVKEENVNLVQENVLDVIMNHEEETKEIIDEALSSEAETTNESETAEPEVQVSDEGTDDTQELVTEDGDNISSDTETEENDQTKEAVETVEENATEEESDAVSETDQQEKPTEKKKINRTIIKKAKRLWNYYWNGTIID